jgi:hypothetical protein
MTHIALSLPPLLPQYLINACVYIFNETISYECYSY